MTEDTSRRARLLGFARATRDTYIPKIAGTVAGSVNSFIHDPSADQQLTRALQKEPVLPEDSFISLYPTYTRKIHNKDSKFLYHVDVNGWLSCPGLMTRKNRLILSLARQLTRGASGTTSQKVEQEAAMVELKQQKQDVYDDSDDESIVSSSSSTNSANAPIGGDTLKERLAGFIARSIPNVELEIKIGSEIHPDDSTELTSHRITTDLNGNFNVCIECNYKPSAIQISPVADDSIVAYLEVMLIEDVGVGVISDIDDTVKLTGVIGDKRELMRSLLLGDVSQWCIQTVVKWYELIYHNRDFANKISFHYISNSPWQLFPTIQKYFHYANLPPGSVHLKQYTGNLIASLMEPATLKKKDSLYKVIGDFPGKKFICVGDSGEYDIEAYTDAAYNYPSHIIAIFIRVVPNSLSDRDDLKILKQINKILARKYANEQQLEQERRITGIPNPISSDSRTSTFSSTEDLIDLDSKPSPPVPRKPSGLRGNPIERKPPLPERTPASAIVDRGSEATSDLPPPTPPRRTTTSSIASPTSSPYDHPYLDEVVDALLEIYPHGETIYEFEEIDKRGTAWVTRVVLALEQLVGTNTEIRFFTDKDTDLVLHSAEMIKKVLAQ